MAFSPTLPAATVFAETDAGGRPRSIDVGQTKVWAMEVEAQVESLSDIAIPTETVSSVPVAMPEPTYYNEEFDLVEYYLTAGEYVYPTLYPNKTQYCNVVGVVTFDISHVNVGTRYKFVVQYTSGSSAKIRINTDQGQAFQGFGSTVTTLTVPNGTICEFVRLREGQFAIYTQALATGLTSVTTALPARARTLPIMGQSLASLAASGGHEGFCNGMADLGETYSTHIVDAGYGGSGLLKATVAGTAYPDNYWWDHAAHTAGPLATTCKDAIAAAIAAGQPNPIACYWNQGQQEAPKIDNTSGVTQADYTAAFVAMIAWLRTQLSLPNLKVIIEPLVNRSSGNAGGNSVVRNALLAVPASDSKCSIGPSNLDSRLKSDGLHWDLQSRWRAMYRLAAAYDNVANSASNPLGPTITAFSQVSPTRYMATISPSSGALVKPDSIAGFGILPNTGALTAITPLEVTAYAWSGNNLLFDLAVEPTAAPRLIWPWDNCAAAPSQIITDASGMPLRAIAPMTAA